MRTQFILNISPGANSRTVRKLFETLIWEKEKNVPSDNQQKKLQKETKAIEFRKIGIWKGGQRI